MRTSWSPSLGIPCSTSLRLSKPSLPVMFQAFVVVGGGAIVGEYCRDLRRVVGSDGLDWMLGSRWIVFVG